MKEAGRAETGEAAREEAAEEVTKTESEEVLMENQGEKKQGETLIAEPEETERDLREETGIGKKSICQKNVSMLV